MNTNKRVMAASAAAILGLFVAGCDDTETEAPAEAPAETVPENEFAETEMGADPMATETGMGSEPTTGATGMSGEATTGAVPEGDAGETGS